MVPAQGAAGELIGDPDSGRITDGTPPGLAAGIRELVARPADRRRSAARAAAERFPWATTVAELLALFGTLDARAPSVP